MKTTFTVSKEFIQEAYWAACSEWKQKLKKQFPEAFATEVNDCIAEIGSHVYDYNVYGVKGGMGGYYILIPLPNANDEWTFEAFDYAKKFCSVFEAYPVHGNSEKEAISILHESNSDISRDAWLVLSTDLKRRAK
jgi:hypothetical protein